MFPIPTASVGSSLKKTKKKLIFDGKPLTPAAAAVPVVIAPDVVVTPVVATSRKKQATEEGYIQSLTEKEHKAYLIAQSHLMTSFSLKKSNGYLNYIYSIQSSNT